MSLKKCLLFLTTILALASCQQPGKNKTGSEYMPDMAHSVAYEANLNSYYERNRWNGEADYYKYVQPRNAVAGTIARGVIGGAEHSGVSSPNGASLYYYDNTEEGRAKAMAEITKSPYPISDKGIAQGKELYTIYCAICHGDKMDGQGYLVRDDGGKYPAQPANFLLDDFINSSNGRYIHSIVYGRNLMGSYADKLSEIERWHVIQYIRSVQAKSKNLAYSEKSNTFNSDALFVKTEVIAEAPKEGTDMKDVKAGEAEKGKASPEGTMKKESQPAASKEHSKH